MLLVKNWNYSLLTYLFIENKNAPGDTSVCRPDHDKDGLVQAAQEGPQGEPEEHGREMHQRNRKAQPERVQAPW